MLSILPVVTLFNNIKEIMPDEEAVKLIVDDYNKNATYNISYELDKLDEVLTLHLEEDKSFIVKINKEGWWTEWVNHTKKGKRRGIVK